MSGSSRSRSPIGSFSENDNNLTNPEQNLEIDQLFDRLKIEENRKTETSSNPRIEILRNIQRSIRNMAPVLDIKNLSVIPTFDGNPNKLHRFISVADSILNHYFDAANAANFQNILLLNGIINKIEGRAEEVIAIHGAKSWNEIKQVLISNFGDQRDENCLNQDLVNLKQRSNESPYQFHEKVIHLLNTICNYIDLNCEVNEQASKRTFFTNQALRTFLAGLKEPLGPIIRAMRPKNLTEALQFIQDEDNIKYLQKPTPNFTQSNFVANKFNTNSHKPVRQFSNQFSSQTYRNPNQQFSTQPIPPQFPRGPINLPRYQNPPTQKYPTNSQVFGKPQNVWKPNPNAVQSKAVPMSISTRNTTPQFKNQNYNHFRNQRPDPNIVVEELFNTECHNYDSNYYEAEEQNQYDQAEGYNNIEYDNENIYEENSENQAGNFYEIPHSKEET